MNIRLPKVPAWLASIYDWLNEPCGWTVRHARLPGGLYQVLRIDLAETAVLVLAVLGSYLYYASAGQALLTAVGLVLVWLTINAVMLR